MEVIINTYQSYYWQEDLQRNPENSGRKAKHNDGLELE